MPTAPEIWTHLATNARAWRLGLESETYATPSQLRVDVAYKQLLKELQEIPARRWFDLCEVEGWNVISATALSWCKGVSLKDSLEAWRRIDDLDMDDPCHWRAARFFNPALLPKPSLKEFIRHGKDVMGVWVLLSAIVQTEKNITIDISREQHSKINKRIANLVQYVRRQMI